MLSREKVNKISLYVGMIVLCIIWLLPIWTSTLISFKTETDYATQQFWQPPSKIAFIDNLMYAWKSAKLGTYFTNSLLYAFVGSLGAIFVASLAGYSLSMLRPKGGFFLFFLIFSGTIFPFQMYLIPLFHMYMNVKLYDTHLGLSLFYIAICTPFCLLIFRNYFSTIPEEIYEAARLDGCSNLGVYWRVFLPLSIPAISILLLFQFTWVWNDLLFGLVLSRSPEVRPVMVGLSQLQGYYAGVKVPGLMAGAIIASIPTILLFVILQRYFIRGLRLHIAGE